MAADIAVRGLFLTGAKSPALLEPIGDFRQPKRPRASEPLQTRAAISRHRRPIDLRTPLLENPTHHGRPPYAAKTKASHPPLRYTRFLRWRGARHRRRRTGAATLWAARLCPS